MLCPSAPLAAADAKMKDLMSRANVTMQLQYCGLLIFISLLALCLQSSE